ncbi:PQQ-binding-like beta-propeller repeat protein [Streptomyces sp. ISL-36]|uniref:outer membrane protein assembly factor BamB family protein n=1 Tax=Streptomyces sp. ISL-36 TaxID=2819182 RepID=UPI001BEB1750|nr:PQQ-binding-like beta-propeller repeat protein [Streptomyces sp. ISL-36]MBT2441949.1 PQQ-binding-like beta-propeller repeat protein [Streptomyces sp. ISL-36]
MTTPRQPGPPPPQQPTYGPYGRLNPYGGGAADPVVPPPPPRRRRAKAVVAAVVAALLAVGGVTWYALDGAEDRTDDKATGSTAPTPSGTATGPAGPPAPDAADAARYNAGRAPGDASVLWVRKNDIDVPGLGGDVFGPWLVGDTVVTAMYRNVTAHSVVDGTVKWRLTLDTEICRAPQLASADGKIALSLKDRLHAEVVECRRLQMVDLRTGKAGWQQKIVKEGKFDFMYDYSIAISGGTVTAGRAGYSSGYRLSDGKQLFGRWEESRCQPYAYAGGPKLVAAVSCPTSDADKPQEEIHEVDPVTGKSRWKYRLPAGYRVDHVLSVRPLVVSATYRAQGGHGIVVLNEDGTKRSSLKGNDQYAEGCADDVAHEGNLERCQVVVDDTTAYLATTGAGKGKSNEIVAFDLRTGNAVRRIPGLPGRMAWPLRMEGGSLIVRMAALSDEPGSLATVAPGATEPVELLRVPRAAGRVESRFSASPALYSDGRYILVQSVVVGSTDAEELERETLLAFGT